MDEILNEFALFIHTAKIESSMGHKVGDLVDGGLLFRNKIEREAERITEKYKSIYEEDELKKKIQLIIFRQIR